MGLLPVNLVTTIEFEAFGNRVIKPSPRREVRCITNFGDGTVSVIDSTANECQGGARLMWLTTYESVPNGPVY